MATTSEFDLRKHLRSRAGEYYQELRNDEVQVHLRSLRKRTNSTLYEFDLAGRERRYAVMVKSPPRTADAARRVPSRFPDRPRLHPQPPPDQKSRLEYVALATIERHLAIARDDRFAAVRMLDLLPDGSALVMEKANGRNLREWLFRASRLSIRAGDRDSLGQALQNAGAWLKEFHELPPLSHTRRRCSRRADFIHTIEQFTTYLSHGSRQHFCRRLFDIVLHASQDLLPEWLPSALSHGDYAPWNVLSETCGRIRVIDTLARFQAPIYEDLAKFLFGMKVSQQQVWTLGHAYKPQDLQWFERQFLSGYFGAEPIPIAQIRLFECQTILERWVAFVHASRTAMSWKRLAKESRRILWELFAKNQISETLRNIEQCVS